MLPVVDPQPVALERVDGAAEPAPDLEHRHLRAGLRTVERRRDPCEPAADHDDAPPGGDHRAARAAPANMLRAATHVFSRIGSETRSRNARSGSAAMRVSRRL